MIVDKINAQNPDLVVVAGDWTYEPENKLARRVGGAKKNCCADLFSEW